MKTSKKHGDKTLSPSTSSVADSPAPTFPKPENGPVSMRELAQVFGLSSPVLLGSFGQDTYSLRTSQASLLTALWDEWSETWPSSGMWDAGGVYELRNSEPPTSESASSSWPTASASLVNDGEAPESWEARRQRNLAKGINGNGQGTPLTIAAQTWPTARQEDGESCGNHPGKSDSLTGATRTWPTPNVPNGGRTTNTTGKREDGSKRQIDLGAAVTIWPTPQAHDETGPRGKNNVFSDHHYKPHDLSMAGAHWQTPATDSFRNRGGDRKEEMGLDQQARFFPTPASRDYRTPNRRSYQERSGTKKGEQLQNFVEHSLPGPPTLDGPPSSPSAPTSRRRLLAALIRAFASF